MEDNLKNKVIIQGFGGKKKNQQQTRYPVEDPEGINSADFPRQSPLTETPGAVSLSKITVLDLISEGEIEGLVTGEYTFEGNIGSVGWSSATMTEFPVAPDTSYRWLRSIYWNNVPVVDNENKYNFQSINVANTNGLPNGSTVGLLSTELTTSRNIGERLRFGVDFAKTYRLYNKDIKAFEVNVRISQLSKTNTNPSEYGDTEETSITYVIKWKPIYSSIGKTPTTYPNYQQEEVRGKISQGYIRSTRVNLFTVSPVYDSDFLGWEIFIQRTTPDSTSNQIRNQSYIDSITEVFGDVFTYPNSAIVSAQFSAEYFSQIPARSFDVKLLKVKIPSNYNPILKTYDGDWDGLFLEDVDGNPIKAWTDNPAWCFYDLITNKRYGLGNYITEDQVDKWTLYDIARYCDTIVPDGFGGKEPRFTCNLIINSREEAYKVVNDMASIFRAMTYYFAGSIYTVQDAFKQAIYQFTNANVEDGNFQYATSSKKARHTVAIVRYNDKNNFYSPAVEYVEDFDAIRKYGIRELELTAFGCTSRGQALRFGKWALLSESLETESVSFVAGPEGAYLRPGDLVHVQDNNRTTQYWGGRVHTIYNSGHFMLDREITGLEANNLYFLSVLTPTYNYEPSLVDIGTSANIGAIRKNQLQKITFHTGHISGVTGLDGVVRSDLSLPLGARLDDTNYIFSGNPVWILEGSGSAFNNYNQWEPFRVLRIEEAETNKFAISALQYATGKFDAVDSGVNFDQTDYSASIPGGPTDLRLAEGAISLFRKKVDYSFTVTNTEGITSFRVFVKKGEWAGASDFAGATYLAAVLQSHERGGVYIPDSDGTYYFRVYAYNRFGTRSTIYAENSITLQGITPLNDMIIGGLMLEDEENETSLIGGSRKVSYPIFADPEFKWQLGVQDNGQLPTGNFYYRFTVREEGNGNTPNSNIYFEETGLLKNGVDNLNYQFTFTDNLNSISTLGVRGPFRNYDVVVEGHLSDGSSTAGGKFNLDGEPERDSDYSNPNGYDILSVRNPAVPAVALTDGSTDTSVWQTDQWLSPEGEIKIKFIKSNFPPDLAGAYAYYSSESFNAVEAKGLVSTTKEIHRVQVLESGNPLVIDAGFTGWREAYLGIALYDLFDVSGLAAGLAVEEGLNISNIVKVTRRSDINFYSSAFFHAWAKLNFSSSITLNTWPNNSYGIREITQTNNPNPGARRFYFKNPLPNTNYIVMGYDHDLYTVIKYTDYFDVQITNENLVGNEVFLGVLYNQDQI